jgi:hypothetical protein
MRIRLGEGVATFDEGTKSSIGATLFKSPHLYCQAMDLVFLKLWRRTTAGVPCKVRGGDLNSAVSSGSFLTTSLFTASLTPTSC